MAEYAVGDVVNTAEVSMNRFKIKNTDDPTGAVQLRIVDIPSKGKPVAVVHEWGDRTGSNNDLLDGHL